MRFSFLVFTFAIVFSSVTYADNLSDTTDIVISMSAIPSSSEDSAQFDKKDAPKDYIKEAQEFEEICRNDREMPLYFKCGCLAEEYLDHRKDLGPEAHSSAVRNRLGEQCKDGSGIAAKTEADCVDDTANAPKGKDLKEFCECYGSKFGKLFEQSPGRMNPRMKVKFMSMARLKCMDPEAAAKIYGVY